MLYLVQNLESVSISNGYYKEHFDWGKKQIIIRKNGLHHLMHLFVSLTVVHLEHEWWPVSRPFLFSFLLLFQLVVHRVDYLMLMLLLQMPPLP